MSVPPTAETLTKVRRYVFKHNGSAIDTHACKNTRAHTATTRAHIKKMIKLECSCPKVVAHGQLYTAFSRGKHARGVRVFVGDQKDGLTDNIVYSELL